LNSGNFTDFHYFEKDHLDAAHIDFRLVDIGYMHIGVHGAV
jgi:hypothetical protein